MRFIRWFMEYVIIQLKLSSNFGIIGTQLAFWAAVYV